jgi:hypothetical protein
MSRSWLGGVGFDLTFIMLGPIFGLFIAYFFNQFNEVGTISAVQAYLIYFITLTDFAHLGAMWFRIHTKGIETRRTIKISWTIALVSMLCLFIVFALNYARYAFMLITYMALYHNIRQNYGFYSFYRKEESKDKDLLKFEKFYVHFALFYPLILWHFDPKSMINHWSHYLVDLSFLYFLKLPLTILLLTFTLLFVRSSYEKYKVGDLSINKIVFFLSVIIGWYGSILIIKDPLAVFFSIVAVHAISYLMYVWKLDQIHIKKVFDKVDFKLLFKRALIFFIFAYIFSYLGNGFRVMFTNAENDIEFFWGAEYWNNLASGMNKYLFIFCIIIPSACQLSHFIIDGYIWKQNRKK